MKGFLKNRYRAISEFLWWIRGEADASSRVRTSNAETDKMAYGVWNYLMWLKSCLCQRLTLVSVLHIRSYRSSHSGNAKPGLCEKYPWAVSLIFSCPWRNSSPKNENLPKLYSPSGHPRCRWVCFFYKFGEIQHLLSNGSSAVNGCHQNESPNSW